MSQTCERGGKGKSRHGSDGSGGEGGRWRIWRTRAAPRSRGAAPVRVPDPVGDGSMGRVGQVGGCSHGGRHPRAPEGEHRAATVERPETWRLLDTSTVTIRYGGQKTPARMRLDGTWTY